MLEVTPTPRSAWSHEGYEPAFGARPLERVIQRRLEDPLALAVLQGATTRATPSPPTAADGVVIFR